jgi:magnesium-protoporphyrin O-methyltransferase
MSCTQCRGIASFFDEKVAARELRKYRKRGPHKTTQMLIDAIRTEAGEAESLLDIGGGIGAVQHALVGEGVVAQGLDVDASPAYLETARAEAERRGYAEKVRYLQGNFVDVADEVPPVDVVTLDRVICCFDDMEQLVTRSSEKAQRLYGLVFPRVTPFTRIGFRVLNAFLRFRRSAFRVFLHPPEAVDALIRARGFSLRTHRRSLLWQVRLYAR